MATDLKQLQTRLWEAADQLASELWPALVGVLDARARADLPPLRRPPVRGAHEELEGKGSGRRKIGPPTTTPRACSTCHEAARFDHLLNLPEGADLGKAVNDAMRAIEDAQPRPRRRAAACLLACRTHVLVELLRLLGRLPESIEGDAFGLIYEYFLGKFAMLEGPEGRRVLHADLDRQADRRDHRAVPRPDLRPRLRLGRHVRPVRALRRAPPARTPAPSSRSTARRRPRRPSASPR